MRCALASAGSACGPQPRPRPVLPAGAAQACPPTSGPQVALLHGPSGASAQPSGTARSRPSPAGSPPAITLDPCVPDSRSSAARHLPTARRLRGPSRSPCHHSASGARGPSRPGRASRWRRAHAPSPPGPCARGPGAHSHLPARPCSLSPRAPGACSPHHSHSLELPTCSPPRTRTREGYVCTV